MPRSNISLKELTTPSARKFTLDDAGHHAVVTAPHPRVATDASMPLIENAVAAFPVPIGIATNFIVNGVERIIPMATTEPTIVAAASYAAKLCRPHGFLVEVDQNIVSGQILFSGLSDKKSSEAAMNIRRLSEEILAHARKLQTVLRHNISIENLDTKVVGNRIRRMMAITFDAEVGDAMGANIVTRIGEAIAEYCEKIIDQRRTAVICTNDYQGPRITATAEWPRSLLGTEMISRIIDLQTWAENDVRRTVTHNKGIMNGVGAVALATGQDAHAIEAASHSFAHRFMVHREYRAPLTQYTADNASILGSLCIRIPLATVGGATQHPTAVWARKVMGVENVRDLAAIVGAVGLEQNFAALRSLADEGILEAQRRVREP